VRDYDAAGIGLIEWPSDPSAAEREGGWVVSEYRRPGVQHVYGHFVEVVPEGSPARDLGPAQVAWRDRFPRSPLRKGGQRVKVVDARGWPVPALWCEVMSSRSVIGDTTTVSGGLAWPRISDGISVDDSHTLLAWQPVWTGFAIDTAVYAVAWAALLALRRRLRRTVPRLTRRAIAGACAASMLLGVAATGAVAWLCATMIDERHVTVEYGESTKGPNYTVWWVYRESAPGALRLNSHWVAPNEGYGKSGPPPSGPTSDFVPSWTDYLAPIDDDDVERTLDARGWPMLALWGGFETRSQWIAGARLEEVTGTRHAIVLPRYYEGELRTDWTRVLPLAPLWPGFGVDALFYSAVFALLLLMLRGPSILVATVRHARGRCIVCGYPRGESSICTECGAPIVAGSPRRSADRVRRRRQRVEAP
jgi:hypothetical protein